MNLQQKINQLEHNLRNKPHGIPFNELPTEITLVNHMKKLYHSQKAIWVKHGETWHYVLLRNGNTPPMNISNWVWE